MGAQPKRRAVAILGEVRIPFVIDVESDGYMMIGGGRLHLVPDRFTFMRAGRDVLEWASLVWVDAERALVALDTATADQAPE
jgi:hypothetical protein